MARLVEFLGDIHPKYHEWNFNVYVIRMWEVPPKNNPKVMTHVELILQDSEGDKLHAVLPCSLLKRWGGVLGEFKMFNMRSFIVVDNSLRLRTIETNYRLTFSNKTVETSVYNPPFPLNALRLGSIGDILHADRINEGEICCRLGGWPGDPREMQSKTGKDLKRLGIVVEDLQ
ncbi:hypothetical protein PIB30_082799 [Stylosanthes scabra]|uniref:Replication protein A 70 kDa DNA-binding subunit B/D first OB fold domain-containing protein n=1 Tax=Stylosanthes scabra TaxID=79078 RepID=A0ABU6VQK4_9FABA|nr:hypothetical protein [Stylosanthes scabra]